MTSWQLQQAKARLSELVKASQAEGPQEITVRGEPAAIVLSKADYEQLIHQKLGFVDFVRESPLCAVELDLKRNRSRFRNVKLG